MKIYGLTERQIIQLRGFWLRHHDKLPSEEPEKIVIVKMISDRGKIIEVHKDSIDHSSFMQNDWKVIQEYEITAKVNV